MLVFCKEFCILSTKQNVIAFIIILGVTMKAVTFESQPEINGFVDKFVIFLVINLLYQPLIQLYLSTGTFKLATVQKVSIKPGKAMRSKRQLFKTFYKPTVKARSIATFLPANLGSRSATAKGQILVNCTTPRGVL